MSLQIVKFGGMFLFNIKIMYNIKDFEAKLRRDFKKDTGLDAYDDHNIQKYKKWLEKTLFLLAINNMP